MLCLKRKQDKPVERMKMKLIQDVHTVPAFKRGYGRKEFICTMTTGKIVALLHRRGVTIKEIFGIYYAIEAQRYAELDEMFGNGEEGLHGGALTVGDAELAGYASPKVNYKQPF